MRALTPFNIPSSVARTKKKEMSGNCFFFFIVEPDQEQRPCHWFSTSNCAFCGREKRKRERDGEPNSAPEDQAKATRGAKNHNRSVVVYSAPGCFALGS